jgi:glucokinase
MAQRAWLKKYKPTAFVADVGGTNARFAVLAEGPDGSPLLSPKTTLATHEFSSFADCAHTWLKSLPLDYPLKRACLAFAGPVDEEQVTLTNRTAWSFAKYDLKNELELDQLYVLNDFTAIGYSLPQLDLQNLHLIPHGPQWPKKLPSTITFLGPGTGLGVGLLIQNKGNYHVIATEGGHVSFAPQDEIEQDILRYLSQRYGRVSAERVNSGPGLKHLYQSLAHITNSPELDLEPSDIVEKALNKSDFLCFETVQRFIMILGNFAGDTALSQGGHAVVIAGGIAPRLLKFMDEPFFRERFDAKGRTRKIMEKIPIAVITESDPGLIGASAYLLAQDS